jgi:Ala-tRNA(Pro) deacylase
MLFAVDAGLAGKNTDAEEALYVALEALGIQVRTVGHPPVATVEDAKRHRVDHGGAHVKNLFVRNKKGAMWLVTVLEDRAVDLKELGRRLGAGHLSFGSPERLRKHLGVEPGSVTPLAAVHDRDELVHVVLDAAILRERIVHCHPLRNDRTSTLHTVDLVRFLEATGHAPTVVDFDASPDASATSETAPRVSLDAPPGTEAPR